MLKADVENYNLWSDKTRVPGCCSLSNSTGYRNCHMEYGFLLIIDVQGFVLVVTKGSRLLVIINLHGVLSHGVLLLSHGVL